MADRGSHARHDRFAIADVIGGGMLPATLGSCPACGALHADLAAIRLALRAAWLPSRPHDLRLSAADAARLRPPRWRRLIAAIGTSRDAITQPLAVAFTGLGLAGLLLTAVPIGVFGGAAGAAPTAASASVEPESHATNGQMPSPATDSRIRVTEALEAPPAPLQVPSLTALSIGLLASGGALFMVRRAARRVHGVR